MNYDYSIKFNQEIAQKSLETFKSFQFDYLKNQNFIKVKEGLEKQCKEMYEAGFTREIDGIPVQFTFTLEDELEMKNLDEETIGSSRFWMYPLEVVKAIYKELLWNKSFCYRYLNILLQYYLEKNPPMIYFGFTNNEIRSKLYETK